MVQYLALMLNRAQENPYMIKLLEHECFLSLNFYYMKGYIARIDVFIKASREAVWHALITPEIVEKYFYGTKLSSSWEIGAPIIFRGEWNGTSYEDKGTILQFEPNSKLVYNYWSSMSGLPDTPEFYQLLTYELTEVENGVRLSITQENLDGDERRKHAEATWLPVLEGLKKIVEETT